MIFAEAFGRDLSESEDVLYICGMTEIVHNGSLMIDDLEDSSLLRRNEPCTYLKYGVDIAVNAGNWMYYAPITRMGEFIPAEKHAGIYQVYVEECLNLHFG